MVSEKRGLDPLAAASPGELKQRLLQHLEERHEHIREGMRRYKRMEAFRIDRSERDDYWYYKVAYFAAQPQLIAMVQGIDPDPYDSVAALRRHLQAVCQGWAEESRTRFEESRREFEPKQEGDEGTCWAHDAKREVFERLARYLGAPDR